jgi:cytoskeletal protein RodZ
MENNESIDSIGNYLKSIREKKKLTIEQVSEKTRIKTRFLENIEKDNFNNLGGTGYAKAIILSYTRAIEADEKHILELMKEKFEKKPKPISRIKSIQPKKLILPTNFFSIIFLIIVAVLLTFLVINLYKNDILTWPPFQRVEKKVEIKQNNKKQKITEKSDLKEDVKEEIEEDQIKINKEALKDTTDYLDEFMFKDKKSPYNYDD